jgi:hypothetical protein
VLRRWAIVLGLGLAGAAGCRETAPPDAVEAPLIAEFHSTERGCLSTFSGALHRQRANQIDELALADTIDRDVLPPWRATRARLEAAHVSEARRALFDALRRYMADRQTAWEAYATALRAPSDAAAREHYDAYHRLDAAADRDARVVGPMLGALERER